ncbi:SDR family oxidoreductase [Rhodococcus xishaensis]|uniref:NAD-dependent epimerase/dehydratase family protein n=1 Tax=Rhodococcus xishaensis TaxID=2487364 RepID=A0A3S3A9W6_9NOCA|nr:NAD(P)H-binding protein [Rhodococcus xishaensis]RVW05303.1 NAD-dependent epimerase/dehydratase family protein [Rhodococcus xishaensis]
MRLAVVGGTGLVGSKVVARARQAGDETVVIARSTGVDLMTGDGLDAALAGCDAVVDVSNKMTIRARPAVQYFSRGAANLVAAAERAGIGHLVTLSIVGIDAIDFGYYLGKRAQEKRVRAGAVPWTVVRATQFFEFPEPLLASKSPIVAVPRMLCQPVGADDVAEFLFRTSHNDPARGTVEIAGPRQEKMVDMARRIVAARHLRRLVVPVTMPGKAGKAMATGGLIPQGDYHRTTTSFDDYLAAL